MEGTINISVDLSAGVVTGFQVMSVAPAPAQEDRDEMVRQEGRDQAKAELPTPDPMIAEASERVSDPQAMKDAYEVGYRDGVAAGRADATDASDYDVGRPKR